MVIISGHIDSRNSDPLNADRDAPGANDDGSGVAAVLEAARILSQRRFPATIVYAVLSGEEQGLYGGKVLADFAKAQGWRVEAVLNNGHHREQPRLRRPHDRQLRSRLLRGRARRRDPGPGRRASPDGRRGRLAVAQPRPASSRPWRPTPAMASAPA